MSGFFGFRSTISDLKKHVRTGKVVAATLIARLPAGETSIAYANAYVWPQNEATGIGADGMPAVQGMVTLWRVGEATGPRVDDKITVGGETRQILSVTPRLNADEVRNFAVYDLTTVV